MKLKATITAPKVHGLGYRYFLMDRALSLNLMGFNAGNQIENGLQQVVVVIEGDEDAISRFRKIVETTHPVGAEVSEITFSDYDGVVRDAGMYAQICTAHQLNKAIPLLLDIRDSSRRIEETSRRTEKNTEKIIDNTQVIIGNTQVIINNTKAITGNTKVIIGNTEAIIDEIRDLHQDIVFDAAWKMRMEQDIKEIKAKIGIRG